MASTSASADTSATASTPKKYNLRNPLPPLGLPRTRSQADVLQASFAECAVNRTVTATWVCRQQRLAMNACMVTHANNREEEDRAREEWFSTHEERRRAKEEELVRVEKRRAEVIKMMREDEERRRQQAEGK
ncbi:uncharacterized protein N7458_006921 [Penicillium daleae]|uniref:COX assembly mitochondrial protein n=1 Tax=Penicillium daleae TaxID=63821 RepID=A0AAD6C690_9EURO|nr:uncharacterized protein N7458_006921 [Penicillium daleae]KAJ5450472.1 hypothetical protein N7458_006921 [Penicillium daleae]